MKNTRIITIGRQIGSGGKSIAKELAKQLDVPCYDKELLSIVAKETGIAKEFFEETDERKTFKLFSGIPEMNFPYFPEGFYYFNNYLTDENLFEMQSKVIRKLADEKSCIFIGRCADYILRDNPNCVKVFICADMDDRIKRVSKEEKLPVEKLRKHIEKMDKQRTSYYNFHTEKIWGMSSSYDLCINSSTLGIEDTIDFIRRFAEKKWGK